jgi:hypothetical protein
MGLNTWLWTDELGHGLLVFWVRGLDTGLWADELQLWLGVHELYNMFLRTGGGDTLTQTRTASKRRTGRRTAHP